MADIKQLWSVYDSTVSNFVFSSLTKLGITDFHRGPSKLTAGLPFIDSPTPLITFIAAYLAIVIVNVVAQKSSRKAKPVSDPAWLRLLVQLHNIFLIGLSGYMCGSAIFNAVKYRYNFWGQNYDESEIGMGRTIYIFYVSKLYEFMDTIIMLLKGKLEQVSFLHVYHHASISAIWWMIAYIAPGGDAWYSCALNSWVHVLMYTYYLLAAALGRDDRARRKYLWWGRYLTQFQMFQFVTMMAQAAYCWRASPYPTFLSTLLFFYMQTLLALFANFYLRKHVLGRKAKRA